MAAVSLPRVVVIGDLIYDVLAEIDGPLNPGTDTFAPVHAHPGGSGANTATWLAHLGIETHLIARVGDDPLGRLLGEELRGSGLRPHLSHDPELPTGKVVVLVDEAGGRTMITARGAGETLSPKDLPQDLFSPQTHLHLSGYLFSGNPRKETALEALSRARQTTMTVSVDPSSTTLLENLGPSAFLEWTRGANLIFPNHEEGAMLTGKTNPDAILDALLGHYRAIVLKLGPEGAAYADTEGRQVRIPAMHTTVVDTTGAGDALCAGFLSTWLTANDPMSALRKGAKIASQAVSRVGGRPDT